MRPPLRAADILAFAFATGALLAAGLATVARFG
jgi:hypothetical protein